jgi:hypothetical protein
MQFLAQWPDGIYHVTHTKDFPHFPITVTPGPATLSVNSEASVRSVEEKPAVERKAANVYKPKKFQANYLKKAIR